MRCLYCDQEIEQVSLYSLLVEEDELCSNCRKLLPINIKQFKLNNIEVETLFDYDSLFKSLLLQFKECYDESLKNVFLYKLRIYLYLKYKDYHVIFMPSSITKIQERGFKHLELIFEQIPFKKIDGLVYKQELIQEGKSKKERELMLDNFEYINKNYKKILLVDDVLTTGSSLLGASKVLINHCDKLKALCLAKANSMNKVWMRSIKTY